MSKAAPSRCALAVASVPIAASGRVELDATTEQSIAGLSPSGSATIAQDYVTGLAGGRGTLYFNGQTYPFKTLGGLPAPATELTKSLHAARSTSAPALPISQAGVPRAPALPG